MFFYSTKQQTPHLLFQLATIIEPSITIQCTRFIRHDHSNGKQFWTGVGKKVVLNGANIDSLCYIAKVIYLKAIFQRFEFSTK
jgi:hypothetical protein